MSNLLEKKNRNVQLTGLQLKNQKLTVGRKLRKTAKNLDRIANEGSYKKAKTPFKAKKGTAVASKSKKMELESSLEQLEILSVKEDNGQVMIEFRAANTSAISIAKTDGKPNQTNHDGFPEIKVKDELGVGATSISAQSIPSAEPHNYENVYDGSTEIKVENEVDIQIEDEMKLCALNSTAQFIPGTDDEDHNNQPIQDQFAEIKIEDEIEFGELSFSVQSIPTNDAEPLKYRTIQDEFTEIEDETERRGEEVEIDELNTLGAAVANKPDMSEGIKPQSELICDICSMKFSKENNMIRHRDRHDKPKFDCNVCGVAKFTQYELDRHMRTHDTNPIYFTCDLCPKKYSSKEYLVTHRKTHDPNAIFFTCEICLKKYPTEISMKKHRERHGKPNFNCNVCGAAKFTKPELDRHMRVHGTNPLYFTCEICSKIYSSKTSLVAHKKTHDNPFDLTCDICSKLFSSKKNLINHRNRHGKPNFNCNICGVERYSQFDLNRHIRKTHNAKKKKSLKAHRKNHQG